jgi:chorismate mutase
MSRTRAPSEVKWLANELAAKRGEIDRIDTALQRLSLRRQKLVDACAALEQVAGQLGAIPTVQAMPMIHAHERYGRRGNLRNWLRSALQQAYPGALDTVTLTEQVIGTFGMTFDSAHARNRFRTDNVANALRRLVVSGEVERLHDVIVRSNATGLWRWKTVSPTLDDLRALQTRA